MPNYGVSFRFDNTEIIIYSNNRFIECKSDKYNTVFSYAIKINEISIGQAIGFKLTSTLGPYSNTKEFKSEFILLVLNSMLDTIKSPKSYVDVYCDKFEQLELERFISFVKGVFAIARLASKAPSKLVQISNQARRELGQSLIMSTQYDASLYFNQSFINQAQTQSQSLSKQNKLLDGKCFSRLEAWCKMKKYTDIQSQHKINFTNDIIEIIKQILFAIDNRYNLGSCKDKDIGYLLYLFGFHNRIIFIE